MNLIKEIEQFLNNKNKSFSDILFVKSENFYLDVSDFISNASFEYNDRCDRVDIYKSLMLVGKDFWIERGQPYGSENWEFIQLPDSPKIKKQVS
jgi:hypothetical protein